MHLRARITRRRIRSCFHCPVFSFARTSLASMPKRDKTGKDALSIATGPRWLHRRGKIVHRAELLELVEKGIPTSSTRSLGRRHLVSASYGDSPRRPYRLCVAGAICCLYRHPICMFLLSSRTSSQLEDSDNSRYCSPSHLSLVLGRSAVKPAKGQCLIARLKVVLALC